MTWKTWATCHCGGLAGASLTMGLMHGPRWNSAIIGFVPGFFAGIAMRFAFEWAVRWAGRRAARAHASGATGSGLRQAVIGLGIAAAVVAMQSLAPRFTQTDEVFTVSCIATVVFCYWDIGSEFAEERRE